MFCLELADIVCLTSMKRNFISFSRFDWQGYFFSFGSGLVQLRFNSHIISNGDLNGGFYRLVLNESVSFHAEFDKSRYALWHRRLGHISQDRMKRFMKDGILQSLPYSSKSWVEYIKGKLTRTKSEGSNCSSNLVVIHSDICGPFLMLL